MLADNKVLQNLFIGRELSMINTRLVESTKHPTVSVRAGALYDIGLSSGTQEFISGPPRDIPRVAGKTFNGFINLSATYNLYNGGARRRSIENARVEELIAQDEIDEYKRLLNNQLITTLATYNNQVELVRINKAKLDNAAENLEIAEERYRGGLINSFDYRIIQQNYIQASEAILLAVFNMKNTETELIRLTGEA